MNSVSHMILGFDNLRAIDDLYDKGCRLFILSKQGILKNRKTAEVRQIIVSARQKRPDILFCVDHEGGSVRRLQEPVTHFPKAELFGRIGDEELVYKCAVQSARELKHLGVGMVLAPMIDSGLRNHYGRSYFTDDFRSCFKMCKAYIGGMHDEGMAVCVKHFPGYITAGDPHRMWQVYNTEDFMTRIRTWEALIEQVSPEAIMLSHDVWEDVDYQNSCSSSKNVVELIRGMSFKGMLVADCIEMPMKGHFTIASRAEACIRAGVDAIIAVNGWRNYKKAVKKVNDYNELAYQRIVKVIENQRREFEVEPDYDAGKKLLEEIYARSNAS